MRLLVFIFFLSILISCQNSNTNEAMHISGRKIFVNSEQYIIKGLCYNPVPKGETERSFSALSEDLLLMNEAGVNTIRLYAPIDDIEILNKIHEAGLKVIIGIGYNQNGFYDILSGTFINYVNKYKDHPAILFWELGNEYNYHPEWFDGDIKNWYQSLNNAAGLIHKTDTNHPVATAHGELPDSLALALCPQIDIWGMNVYRWDNPETIFKQWEKVSEKPMYLSEAGADSYMTIANEKYHQGVNEQSQANAVENILEDVFGNPDICSGVALFAFIDELWKAGEPDVQNIGGWAPNSTGVPYDGTPNEEYWGIVDVEKNKKEAYFVVKEVYSN